MILIDWISYWHFIYAPNQSVVIFFKEESVAIQMFIQIYCGLVLWFNRNGRFFLLLVLKIHHHLNCNLVKITICEKKYDSFTHNVSICALCIVHIVCDRNLISIQPFIWVVISLQYLISCIITRFTFIKVIPIDRRNYTKFERTIYYVMTIQKMVWEANWIGKW